MDRLLSEQAVLDAFRKYQGFISDFYKVIKAIPSAEPKCESCELNRQRFMQTLDVAFELGKASAEPYKGMTNGEVMDKLFPEISEHLYDDVFTEDWWNSPYEPQESEG